MNRESRTTDHILFFADNVSDTSAHLGPEDMRHAAKVLRAGIGDKITCTDGQGGTYSGPIQSMDDAGLEISIAIRETARPCTPLIDLYVGLPQRAKFEELVALVVPLGVSSITPVVCQYCQDKWWIGKWAKHEERISRKIVTACKQSHCTWFPTLNAVVDFGTTIGSAAKPMLHADEHGFRFEALSQQLQGANQVSCFVGPPGGFSPEELGQLAQAGSQSLWLAPHRLRTELAASTALALLSQLR